MFFNKVSYRRGVIEGLLLFTLGRLCALISPMFFPDWTYVAAPLLFLLLQYLIAPYWATRRIESSKRERLSRRFWLLGPRLALLCFGVELLITLFLGEATGAYGTQLGPVIMRLFVDGSHHLTFSDWAIYEATTVITLLALHTLTVVCTRLARGGFLRFTMPAGGNRVTL
jgi:hypothetical protein